MPKRKSFTYYPGMVALASGSAPNLLNKSFSITADVEAAGAATEGAIFSMGGGDGCYGIYVKAGRPVFAGIFLGRSVTRVTSSAPLPSGAAKVRAEFRYDGGGLGKGGVMTLFVNDQKVARAASLRRKALRSASVARSTLARTQARRSTTPTRRHTATTA